MLTPEQKQWLDGFMACMPPEEEPAHGRGRHRKHHRPKKGGTAIIVAELDGEDEPSDEEGGTAVIIAGVEDGEGQQGRADEEEGVTRALSIPTIPSIPGPGIKCTINFVNKSDHGIELVSSSLENPNGSEFETSPPQEVEAQGGTGTAVVSNNFPYWTGVGGQAIYKIAGEEGQTTHLYMQWERGRVPNRHTKAELRPANPKYTLEGGFQEDDFTFTFKSKGGSKPNQTHSDVASSCQITVTNKTDSVLILLRQAHDKGDFITFPPQSLDPGASYPFVSAETPHAKEQGCKGNVTWQVGDPPEATWRIEWDNPEGEKNTVTGTLTPASAGFKSLEQIGQGDENVPTAFTLSGGSGGGGGGGGGTKPGPEPAFVPPPESKQPTLRKGDKSGDGWVEYMQQLLNQHLHKNLPVSGTFDGATHKAVLEFQTMKSLQVDGTVGNQTWAALRDAPAEPPSSDGRKPHTYVEDGPEARWQREGETCVYHRSTDEAWLLVNSVGTADIASGKATVKVTPPGGQAHTVAVPIGPATQTMPDGQGNVHTVKIPKFLRTFKSKPPGAAVGDYAVEAYLPADLGGDHWTGPVAEG